MYPILFQVQKGRHI